MNDPDGGAGARRPAPLARLLARFADLFGAERRALRLQARRLSAAGLIAPRFYRADAPGATGPAAEHYLRHGAAAARDPHPAISGRRLDALFGPGNGDGANPLLRFIDRAEAEDAGLPNALRCALEPLPATLRTGLGTALFVRGWAYAPRGRIRFLDLMVGDARFPVTDHSQPRADVLDTELAHDPEGNSFFSGFEAVVPLPPVPRREDRAVRLRLVTRDGAVLEREVGRIALLPGDGRAPAAVDWPGAGEPRVAICMATHNPPPDLFAEQVASIKAQTHRNWVCIVSDDASQGFALERMRPLLDDPRFVLLPNRDRLDFYGNFERALGAVPADADFVALSDQDDRWHPDKLATLVAAMDGGAELAFADVRVVDPEGRTLSDTFWTARRNNFTSLPSLLSANTVMGAACLFRASLLPRILPFPERLGAAYHDHWIGLNALVAGAIRYVDRPLHDYVQHGGNVIGHKRDADAPGLAAAGRAVLTALRRRGPLGPMLRDMVGDATRDRQSLVAQKAVLARVLLLRHPGARPAARRVLERMSGLTGLAPALRERLLAAAERRPTLNHEGHFLRAVLISRLREAAYRALRGPQSKRIGRRRRLHGLRRLIAEGDAGRIDFRHSGHGRDMAAMDFGHVGWIFHNVSPLTLRPSRLQPKRVNLLLATINFDYLFGGYIGMFNLALRLRRDGHAVRIVLLDETEVRLADWRARIARYPGLGDLFDAVEVAYRFDRSLPLDVSPDDRFVATSGWSAHVAHKAEAALGRERFLFLIQEYEPFFGPMNTNTALLRQAYDFPQFGLFSTAILRDYFRENRIGLFEAAGGEDRSAVFSNAIQRFSPTRAQLERRSRRILFYARPEDHAARNMFEMGIAALVALFSDPAVAAAGWTAHGIGSIRTADRLELVPGTFLRMVPKTSLQGYIDMLPGFDVGLSLMLTPHPSLVPLEMAAAGLPTVTNTFANKTAAALHAISPNLIGAKPTLEGIVEGLRTAIARVDDVEARLAGAQAMTWPTDWEEAFPAEAMDRVNAFLRD